VLDNRLLCGCHVIGARPRPLCGPFAFGNRILTNAPLPPLERLLTRNYAETQRLLALAPPMGRRRLSLHKPSTFVRFYSATMREYDRDCLGERDLGHPND
jgi:hypothetical protein